MLSIGGEPTPSVASFIKSGAEVLKNRHTDLTYITMKIRKKSTGKWVNIPDGPTPEEEAEIERYKRTQADPFMAYYDQRPVEQRRVWAETGRPQ